MTPCQQTIPFSYKMKNSKIHCKRYLIGRCEVEIKINVVVVETSQRNNSSR